MENSREYCQEESHPGTHQQYQEEEETTMDHICHKQKKEAKQPITKTRLYNFDPLKLHFYTVKLGFTGVYTIFLILLKNTDCEYSLKPPRRGGSNKYPQSMFRAGI